VQRGEEDTASEFCVQHIINLTRYVMRIIIKV